MDFLRLRFEPFPTFAAEAKLIALGFRSIQGYLTMKIAGSQTERNLLAAFAGESQARNRYTYFAGQAKKDGFVQIAQIFEETANQEKEHAKRFFKFLEGGEVEIQAVFPAGIIGTTAENLLAAANGENEEWTKLYPGFAEVARSEGFPAIAKVLEMICVAEKQHEKRYRGLLANVESGTVFKRAEPVVWRCLNCGYLHEGPEAPAACPACAHPQAFFEVLAENW
jgi:rubrerythrin